MLRLRPPRQILRNTSGATALEFALVAAPFFFMVLCIIELGMVYLVTTSLDNATQEAARQIRTGELALKTGAPATAATFRQTVCDNMGWLQDQCMQNLAIDVRASASFAGAAPPGAPPPDAGGNMDNSKLLFSTGAAGDIMIVTSFYRWKLITPVLYGGLQSSSYAGMTVVRSTSTFRNEPYST